MTSNEIIKISANALNEKKGKQLAAIKIADITVLCEYFVICTASSSTQLRALCDEVEEKLSEAGLKPHHIEGRSTGWVCLDYGSVIVHIFTPHEREFYSLDKMWSDGENIDLTQILDNCLED